MKPQIRNAILCASALIMIGGIIQEAKADLLSFSFADPTEDHFVFRNQKGLVTDIVGLNFYFDSGTGDYEAIMTATKADPFIGELVINVNLYNGDTDSNFFDNLNVFVPHPPRTSIRLAGSDPELLNWRAGHRIAACEGPGGAVPEPCLGGLGSSVEFSSGVVNFGKPRKFPSELWISRDHMQSAPPATVVATPPAPLTVLIDIRPRSAANRIRLRSAGVIPVAILSSGFFDATTVNPATIFLSGAGVKLAGESSSCAERFADEDDLPDLVCQIETAEFLIGIGETSAELSAQTFGGALIRGVDNIKIVP